MSVSARNLLAGKVATISKGAINAEVELSLDGGEKIVVVVTNRSVDNLVLKEGTEAFVLIKAPLVILEKGDSGLKFSARNVLRGTVKKIAHGTVNAEVAVELSGGATITSIITEGSVSGMQLQEGDRVNAIFKASSAILAVKA